MKQVIFAGLRWEIDDQLAGDLTLWLEWAEKYRIEEPKQPEQPDLFA